MAGAPASSAESPGPPAHRARTAARQAEGALLSVASPPRPRRVAGVGGRAAAAGGAAASCSAFSKAAAASRLVAARLVRHSKCVVRLAHGWLESDRAPQLGDRITGSMQVGQGCAEPDPGYGGARIALDRPFEVGDSRSIVLADALAHAESIGAVERRPYRFGLLYNAIASSHARRIRLSFASPSRASSRSGRAASAASYSVSAAWRRSCASSDSAMS